MKLLIIKTSSLGDIVQAKEVLHHLKNDEVHWVVEAPFKDLLEDNVHKTLVVDTKKWRKNLWQEFREIRAFIEELRKERYDKVIDLQGNFKSSLILALARSPLKVGFGWAKVPERINWFFTNHHITPLEGQNIRHDYLSLCEVKEFSLPIYSQNLALNKVVIGLGSRWKNKQLPQDVLRDFLFLFQQSFPQAQFHFLWGSEVEKAAALQLKETFSGASLVPKLSFKELENYLKSADFYIGMDSFPLHLAGSLKIPTFAFFGPSSAKKYSPDANYFQGNCPYGRTFEKRCPVLRTCPTGACLRDPSALTLWKQFINTRSV